MDDNLTHQTLLIGPQRRIEPLGLGEIWKHREMLAFLAMRDIKVRYRQTVLGGAWAVLQPVSMMLVMTFVFGKLGRVDSGKIPYPIFAFSALLPWQLFASSLARTSQCAVAEQALITKVYFPRLILPLAALCSSFVDFCIGLLVLLGLMIYYQMPVQLSLLGLPLVILLTMLTALAFGIWFAALNTRYRDVGHIVPLLTQIWMFLSPIMYPSDLVSKNFSPTVSFIYHLNPVAVIAECARWAVLGDALPPLCPTLFSLGATLILLIFGVYYYKRQADNFADYV